MGCFGEDKITNYLSSVLEKLQYRLVTSVFGDWREIIGALGIAFTWAKVDIK